VANADAPLADNVLGNAGAHMKLRAANTLLDFGINNS
jgi:hypothetical protein